MKNMMEDTDIRIFFDISITHFPDRSARWLLQYMEFVQGLLEIVAPRELVDHIDFSQLRQLNRSLLADTLREQEADLLFRVPYKQGIGFNKNEPSFWLVANSSSKGTCRQRGVSECACRGDVSPKRT